MTKPVSLMIDDVKYVQEAAIAATPAIYKGLQYAIVRSREAGVIAGYIKSVEGRTVEVICGRQLWRWDSNFVLIDMAMEGVRDARACKFSVESAQSILMTEACAVIYCSEVACSSIRKVKAQVINK